MPYSRSVKLGSKFGSVKKITNSILLPAWYKALQNLWKISLNKSIVFNIEHVDSESLRAFCAIVMSVEKRQRKTKRSAHSVSHPAYLNGDAKY